MQTTNNEENYQVDNGNEVYKVTVKQDGIILYLAFYLFNIFRQISIFQLVRNVSHWMWSRKKKKNGSTSIPRPFTLGYLFPEVWVLANIAIAIIGCFAVALRMHEWVCCFFCIYAILRTFELFVYQINVLLFDPIKSKRSNYEVKSATRTVLLLICNMFEYVLWFSVVYLYMNKEQTSFHENFQIVMKSVTTLANIDSPEEQFKSVSIIYVAYIESVIGIFMNIVCLARFISLLPSVKINDET